MTRFPCPYLGRAAELTAEREEHIAANHPDLLPQHRPLLATVLQDPDTVRGSSRIGNALLFSRFFPRLSGGKHVVIVVMTDGAPRERSWIVTAYLARRLAPGGVEWSRS